MTRRRAEADRTGDDFGFVVEIAVVAGVIGVCVVLMGLGKDSLFERARGAEWFALTRSVQVAMHEQFALTGEWQLPQPMTSTGSDQRATCSGGQGSIHCELAGGPGGGTAGLEWKPVTTAGAVNWACVAPPGTGMVDGSVWFHVCRNRIFSMAHSTQGQ